jgi:hypothetical protein
MDHVHSAAESGAPMRDEDAARPLRLGYTHINMWGRCTFLDLDAQDS